jgi:hypothetical protein
MAKMMTNNPSGSRRRKFKRFKIKGSAVVLLHRPGLMGFGKPRLVELGPITDISMGGLALQYLEHKKRDLNADLLTIVVPEKDLKVEGLSFRVVSDQVLATLPGGRNIHSCCIEFVRVTAYQSFKLESFIKACTTQMPRERRKLIERRRLDDPSFHQDGSKAVFDRRSGRERRGDWPPQ